MTPRVRAVALAVDTAGALTDAHRAAIRSLHRAQPERTATLQAADVTILEIAARMAHGLPVSGDAIREVGMRYLEMIVELGKQVDARMSAEADAAACRIDSTIRGDLAGLRRYVASSTGFSSYTDADRAARALPIPACWIAALDQLTKVAP